MAIGATAVWEIRTTATAGNVNGGFYIPGSGTPDYSQQPAAQYALTSVGAAGAGAVLTHASASADMVGNGLKVVSGTNLTVGWYEIISVVAGVSITVDRAVSTGVSANGVINIGGALSLASSDDAVFESPNPGNKFWIKAGTYAINGTVTIAKAGSPTNPIEYEGYATVRGDKPIGASAPSFNCAAASFSMASSLMWSHINFFGTATVVVIAATGDRFNSCGFLNNSTTADRTALQVGAVDIHVYRCDIQSYRGRGITSNATATGLFIDSNYIHDSDVGIRHAISASSAHFTNNILRNMRTAAINVTTGTAQVLISRNTLIGCNNTGIGIDIGGAASGVKILGNVICGFATGVNNANTSTTAMFDDFNNYYDNTSDVANWTKGPSCTAVDPQFADATDIIGTNGTTSGSVFTSAGKDFTVLGVMAGRDFIYMSGTGVTTGFYGITIVGTTTLTLDIAPGTSAVADKVYQILKGSNFIPGATLYDTGAFDFPGGYTTTSPEIGAVQVENSAVKTYSRGRVVNQ